MRTVRKARLEDLPEILKIYDFARGFMRRTGNPTQWSGGYPAEELLREDIQNGNLYLVMEEETIQAVFAFIPGEDLTYRYIEGAWHEDRPYAAIHRVASGGSGGVFGVILDYCKRQCPYLRIDTHRDNLVMQHVLEKHGFQPCGIIYLPSGDPRIAFDYA